MSDTTAPTLRSVWICRKCDVLGADPEVDPTCWNCSGPVTVTARVEPTWVGYTLGGLTSRIHRGQAA